ncbi:MAG: hypothetical protein ACE5FA_06450 [Dehalococcoidia bacterium]
MSVVLVAATTVVVLAGQSILSDRSRASERAAARAEKEKAASEHHEVNRAELEDALRKQREQLQAEYEAKLAKAREDARKKLDQQEKRLAVLEQAERDRKSRAKAAADAIADAAAKLAADIEHARVEASKEWTHERVVALRDSAWNFQNGYLTPMAIIRKTGHTKARFFTEDEQDAFDLMSACNQLAMDAFKLSVHRKSLPRPRALRRTANAALAAYNRLADYCGVPRRQIDSPVSTHAEAIARQKAASDRERAAKEVAKGRWNSRKLFHMQQSVNLINDKRKRSRLTELINAAGKLSTPGTSGPAFERYTAACEKALALFNRLRPSKDGRKRTVRDF